MDVETLIKRRLPEGKVELPGVGTVRVRGLSRAESNAIRESASVELGMLKFGMVDPELTEEQAKQWQENSPMGEIGLVTDVIARLSGLYDGADKDAMQTFREESSG